MKKKIIYLMFGLFVVGIVDISLFLAENAFAAKPKYLESCTYDESNFLLWYECGYVNHGDDCDPSNC